MLARPLARRNGARGRATIAIVELTLITTSLTLGERCSRSTRWAMRRSRGANARRPPHSLAEFAWLPRVGLSAYTVATIVSYIVIGPTSRSAGC
jgi:hypothetical protein